jgi:hypothetical protein
VGLEMMFDIIWNYIVFQLAGIWTLLASYGIGAVLIAICLAGAFFSPLWKKDFLWAAAVIAILMFSFTIGVSQGERRVQAQWDLARSAAVKQGKEARAGAVRDVARKPSKWLPNHRDIYDRDGQ